MGGRLSVDIPSCIQRTLSLSGSAGLESTTEKFKISMLCAAVVPELYEELLKEGSQHWEQTSSSSLQAVQTSRCWSQGQGNSAGRPRPCDVGDLAAELCWRWRLSSAWMRAISVSPQTHACKGTKGQICLKSCLPSSDYLPCQHC